MYYKTTALKSGRASFTEKFDDFDKARESVPTVITSNLSPIEIRIVDENGVVLLNELHDTRPVDWIRRHLR